MKNNLVLFILLLLSPSLFGQTSKTLTKTEADHLKNKISNVAFPIFKAYQYNDIVGLHNLLLCENKINETEKNIISTKIEAICYLKNENGYQKKWSIVDHAEQEQYEISMWFWTKYCSTLDIDGDKQIDPIIVYGTKTEDGINRVKIITIYKAKKYAIRAIECELDDCRKFEKDSDFKELPSKIRLYIDKLLQKIRIEQNVLLKNG